jgi:hypothetical protein
MTLIRSSMDADVNLEHDARRWSPLHSKQVRVLLSFVAVCLTAVVGVDCFFAIELTEGGNFGFASEFCRPGF